MKPEEIDDKFFPERATPEDLRDRNQQSHYSPTLEMVRDDIYDTKYLNRQGSRELIFFKAPGLHIGQQYFNSSFFTNIRYWDKETHGLHNPQEFLLFGIAVEFLSIELDMPEHALLLLGQKEIMRQALFAPATIDFTIGCKCYWTGPLSRVLEGTFPCYYEKYVEEKRCNEQGVYHTHGFDQISRRHIHYLDLTLPTEGGPLPIYIPKQQTFWVRLSWNPHSAMYYPYHIGHVLVKVYLCGLRHREIC